MALAIEQVVLKPARAHYALHPFLALLRPPQRISAHFQLLFDCTKPIIAPDLPVHMNSPSATNRTARDPQGTESPPSTHAGTAPRVTPSHLPPVILDGSENLLNLPSLTTTDDDQGDINRSTLNQRDVGAAELPFLPLSMVPISPSALQDRMSLPPPLDFARSPYARSELPRVSEATYSVANPSAGPGPISTARATAAADSRRHYNIAPVSTHYSEYNASHVATSGQQVDAAGSDSRRSELTAQRQSRKKGVLCQKLSSIMKRSGSETK